MIYRLYLKIIIYSNGTIKNFIHYHLRFMAA